MGINAEGAEGTSISVDDEKIVIRRTGFFARVRQGAEVVTFLRDVTGVHISPPRLGFRGFLHILVGGEAPTTWTGANQHPRCLYFDARQLPAINEVAAFISRGVAPVRPLEGTGLDSTGAVIGDPPAPHAVAPTQRPNIVVITSSPDADAPLALDNELNRIRDSLEGTPNGRRFQLELRPAARVDELVGDIIEYPPTILHFSGHGVVAGLILTAQDGTMPVLANPVALAHMAQLPGVHANLKVLLLNVCLSVEQANFLAQWVPAVIGTTDNVPDSVAIAFAQGFYVGVGNDLSLAGCFAAARAQAALVSPEGAALYVLASTQDPDAISLR